MNDSNSALDETPQTKAFSNLPFYLAIAQIGCVLAIGVVYLLTILTKAKVVEGAFDAVIIAAACLLAVDSVRDVAVRSKAIRGAAPTLPFIASALTALAALAVGLTYYLVVAKNASLGTTSISVLYGSLAALGCALLTRIATHRPTPAPIDAAERA